VKRNLATARFRCETAPRRVSRIGAPRELLSLTPEEEALIEIEPALAKSLRARRKDLGLSQTLVVRRIRSSRSRVAKMEGGDALVSIARLVRSLLAIGATRKDVARVIGSRVA